MYVYVVELVYPYEGSIIKKIFKSEKKAKIFVRLNNKKINPVDEFDEYYRLSKWKVIK